jgi:nucleoside-diphosphate-sugar epimerase
MSAAPKTPTGDLADLHGTRVLILGGLGFLGINIAARLRSLGATVTAVDRSFDPLRVAWFSAATAGGATLVQGVVGAAGEVWSDLLASSEVVVNLTGRSGAARSLDDPLSEARSNVVEQLALLEAVRRCSTRPRVIFASSRLVYGATDGSPVDEDDPCRPNSLYGADKLVTEHYLRIYGHAHGVPYTILRLTNPYGPYQLPGRVDYGVINQFLLAAARGEAITIYGDGAQLRDYVHVDDVTRAVALACVEPAAAGETFNIGAGRSQPLHEVATTIGALAGSPVTLGAPWPARAARVETGDFRCDVSRAGRILGWAPRIGLAEGLKAALLACSSLSIAADRT